MEYSVIKFNDNLYHFRDPLGVCFSIIKGSKKAIVVDTGYGIFDVKKTVEEYITTPYIVINTHGHMDHTAGNFRFDKVYVPSKDYDLFIEHNSIKRRTKNIQEALLRDLLPDGFDKDEYINQPTNNSFPIDCGQTIDLGNLHVEIIPMEGHTKGSIGLLIKELKILLTGDAAIHAIWMFLKESTDRNTYINMLKRVKQLDFDYFVTGHLMEMYPKKYFDYYIEVAKNATPSNSKPTSYGDFGDKNTFEYVEFHEGVRFAFCYQEPKEY